MTSVFRRAGLQRRRILFFLLFFTGSILFVECSSTVSTTLSTPIARPKITPAPLFTPPDGWAILTDSIQDPSITVTLERTDHAAGMVLKELHLLGQAQQLLQNEDIRVAGNVSLRTKLNDKNDDTRILRTPTLSENSATSCFYTYSNHFILHRVLVFRTRSKLYELELVEETEGESLSQFINDQNDVARSFMRE